MTRRRSLTFALATIGWLLSFECTCGQEIICEYAEGPKFKGRHLTQVRTMEAFNYQEQARVYETILPEAEAAYGKAAAAGLYNNLGNVYRLMGQHVKAEALYQRSLQTYEEQLGKEAPYLSAPLANLASAYQWMGQPDRAEGLLERRVRIWENRFKKNRFAGPEAARSLLALAEFHHNLGRYEKAEPLLQRSLEILAKRYGKQERELAPAVNALARLYHDMDKPAEAEVQFRRSLALFDVRFVPADLQKIIDLYKIIENQGERAGEEYTPLVAALAGLAQVHVSRGQFDKAEPLCQSSLDIVEGAFGRENPRLADRLRELADVYHKIGRPDKAEPLHMRAYQIRQAKLGADHPDVTQSLHDLAWHDVRRKRWDRAFGNVGLARRGIAHHLATILPVLSEREQLTYLQFHFTEPLHRALSLGCAQPGHLPLLAGKVTGSSASAEWLLNGKAIAHQSLAEQHLQARDAQDAGVRKILDELQQTRTLLAASLQQLPTAGKESDHQKKVQELRAGEQMLAEKLARAVGRPYRADPWIRLDELRARLGAKAVFVDVARFPLWDFSANKSQGDHYVAWITPPAGGGNVRIIDLGEAEAIDKVVDRTRQLLLDGDRSVRKVGEIEAWEALQKPLQDLSARVLHPLAAALGRYEEWIICPDGALWLTPWTALLLPDGKFAVEKHVIQHVVSGRDLVQEASRGKTESAYIFADPDYDLPPDKVFALAGVLPARNAADVRSSGSAQRIIPRVRRLEGTALEAEAIRPRIERWSGRKPVVHLEGEASETLVRSVKNSRVLVLATHGYFLPTQEVEGKARLDLGGKRRAALLDRQRQPIENPLLRCGLLLAGCNQRADAKPGADDGILTGLEIVGMNLQGCELVVLSACETGLGDVRQGEGVAGLRQAFQLAGARGVLASLWQVPDRETALLMNAFCGELTRDPNQAKALREAQLQRIESRRRQFGAAHPFFWAAFTLTTRGPN